MHGGFSLLKVPKMAVNTGAKEEVQMFLEYNVLCEVQKS